MKTEWLVTYVTATGSPGRAERAILGGFWLGVFFANPGCFVVGGPLCDVRTSLWALLTALVVIVPEGGKNNMGVLLCIKHERDRA